MNKQLTITIKGIELKCIASVTYSNCLRIEFRDESKTIFATGYKSHHLGLSNDLFSAMQTIEIDAVDYIEHLLKCKVNKLQVGELIYSYDDIELQRQWKAFLSGESDKLRPKFNQLSLL